MTEDRRPVLEAALRAAGAQFASVDGCLLPERFTNVADEVQAVRSNAGVIDRTDRGWLAARGADARRFLHGMVSNEVQALAPGDGRYALQLDAHGHVLADLYVLALEDQLLLETDWSLQDKLRANLERYLIADDVELADRSDELAALDVDGPQAAALLRAAGADTLPEVELAHRKVHLGDVPVRLVRLSETGEEGFRLLFAVELAQNVWDALAAQRERFAWRPVGHAALNVLRVEAGLPRYGPDMDERTLAPEASVEQRAISYTKGCYIGQETVERIRSRGHVNRHLAGLLLETSALPAAGTKLRHGSKQVGWLTTAVDSPTLRRPIALGYLRREHLKPGTRLEVEGGGAAEVAELPFVGRS